MEITAHPHAAATVLALNGRLDGLTSPALEGAINAQLAAGQARLVFDCALLSYVSSAGLRVFLSAAKKAQAAGGKVAFSTLQASVAEIFELSGFNNLFALHASTADAVAALA